MARYGKLAVKIADGCSVRVEGDFVVVEGNKGVIKRRIADGLEVKIGEEAVFVEGRGKKKADSALQGTLRSHLFNMIKGVSEGWTKNLEIVGSGYRASVNDKKLLLSVGYSHLVEIEIPDGLNVTIEKSVIKVDGYDKEVLGLFAARVRSVKEPEPYKGTGIRYQDEEVRRKAGKQAAKTVGG